jgi:mannose-6-phosphate isomerase-like protein (cupin superfamily)
VHRALHQQGRGEAAVLTATRQDGAIRGAFQVPGWLWVATHSHPTDEFVTVISGKGRMAFGEDAAEANARPLATGTFTSLPGGAWHHLWIDAETVVELHSTGPFGVDLLTK